MTEGQPDISSAGTIFLSHASPDKPYVFQILKRLDPAVTFYDVRSISPGQKTLEAMRLGVDHASVFVLFHSEINASAWVDFEKDLAQLQLIQRRSFQVLVCPIGGSTHRTLPDWMKAFMTTTEAFKPSDIVRTIRYLYRLSLDEVSGTPKRQFPGREPLKREITLLTLRYAASAQPLSALVLSGIQGMGRGTLAAELIREAYRGMRPGGPVFEIPDAGDAIDWHLHFLSDLDGSINDAQIALQIDAFSKLSARSQAQTLLSSLLHWETLNQVVTIRHRWGLRERGNSLKPWLAELLQLLKTKPGIRLILISERQLPHPEVHSLGNIAQFNLADLDSDSIQYILSSRIPGRHLNARKLPDLAEKIGGHPATANYVAFLVGSGRSMDSLASSPSEIYSFQDSILVALYESNTLSSVQKSILHLLSWFPRLPASIITEVFPEAGAKQLTEELWSLVDYSLVNQVEEGRYRCPAVVSSTYRRRNEGGYDDIVTRVASLLAAQFENSSLDFELIDALVVAVVSLGMDISPRLKAVLTPARLLPAIELQHSAGLKAVGNEAKLHFDRCRALAELAMSFKMADDDLENILFYGGDSSVRLGIYPSEMIRMMNVKGMLTADYIEGSYLYHRERDYEKAANVLSKSLSASRFRIRNVRLLARIYLRDGKFSQALTTLEMLPDTRLVRDTGLIVMKIKALRGTRNHAKANGLLKILNSRTDDYGEIALYSAGVALREGKHREALRLVEKARQAPNANQAVLSILQCACEIEGGNLSSLSVTCATARSIGRDSDALQLQARAALQTSDWQAALDYINQVGRKDWFDLNVELRAVEGKLGSPAIKRNPVLLSEASEHRDHILRVIADAIEGNNLAY